MPWIPALARANFAIHFPLCNHTAAAHEGCVRAKWGHRGALLIGTHHNTALLLKVLAPAHRFQGLGPRCDAARMRWGPAEASGASEREHGAGGCAGARARPRTASAGLLCVVLFATHPSSNHTSPGRAGVYSSSTGSDASGHSSRRVSTAIRCMPPRRPCCARHGAITHRTHARAAAVKRRTPSSLPWQSDSLWGCGATRRYVLWAPH